MQRDTILVVDFGSQYTHLIARRLRESGVYSVVEPWNNAHALTKYGNGNEDGVGVGVRILGVVLSGGPDTATRDNAPSVPAYVVDSGLPVLGVCYGMQALAAHYGGTVTRCEGAHEYGYAKVAIKTNTVSTLLHDIGLCDVWMSHGDEVSVVPDGFEVTASSNNCAVAAMADCARNVFGVQFHQEVTQTLGGYEVFERFATDICGCQINWSIDNVLQACTAKVFEHSKGDGKVLLALSGGVDSTVLATLLQRVIGNRLVCVFVDNGLFRKGEIEDVLALEREVPGLQVRVVNAAKRFYRALQGIEDPEEKRKAVGRTFIEVFEETADALDDNIEFLAQGTIYPDVIESAATVAARVIKSHHNVGGLPDHMKLKLVEPLRELFKDEVRMLGRVLELPEERVQRHPFPGPGLAIRIMGEVTEERLAILREVDHIFLTVLRDAELYDEVSQAFAVFLPVKSVGVVGDARRYGYVVSLRAVSTSDFMTAQWAHIPHAVLARASEAIMNRIEAVARVTYDISSKPPATIEWE